MNNFVHLEDEQQVQHGQDRSPYLLHPCGFSLQELRVSVPPTGFHGVYFPKTLAICFLHALIAFREQAGSCTS